MPIGTSWALGSWPDGAWADHSWANAGAPPAPPKHQSLSIGLRIGLSLLFAALIR